MNNLSKISIGFFCMLLLISFSFLSNKEVVKNITKKDLVPDEATAKKIAEAIWFPLYGKMIYNEKPFIAHLENDSTWLVIGTLKGKMMTGGTATILINKKDCRILEVYHGK
jgi:hypothetical protein